MNCESSSSLLTIGQVFEFLLMKDTPQNLLDQDNSVQGDITLFCCLNANAIQVETNRLIGKFKVPFKSFIQFFPVHQDADKASLTVSTESSPSGGGSGRRVS